MKAKALSCLGLLLLNLAVLPPAQAISISGLTSTNQLQSTNLFEVSVQKGGSNVSYSASLQTIANSMPTVPSAASLAGASTNTVAHAYDANGAEFFTVNGTNGQVSVKLGNTNGLRLQSSIGGKGYQFIWRTDHLALTNEITGSWLDLGGGGLLPEMSLIRSDGTTVFTVDSSGNGTFYGNITAAGGVMVSTNAWNGPTNSLPLANGFVRYSTVTPVNITNVTLLSSSVLNWEVLLLRNDSGSNLNARVEAGLTTSGDGVRNPWTGVVTNGTTLMMYFNAFGIISTNFLQRTGS